MRIAAPFAIAGACAGAVVVSWLLVIAPAFHSVSKVPPVEAASFIFFGLPIAVLALVLVFWPVTAAVRARRTFYAITDRRVLILRGPGDGGFEEYAASDVRDVEVRALRDGVGDVVFAHSGQTLASGRELVRAAGFSWVRDADAVAEQLRALGAGR